MNSGSTVVASDEFVASSHARRESSLSHAHFPSAAALLSLSSKSLASNRPGWPKAAMRTVASGSNLERGGYLKFFDLRTGGALTLGHFGEGEEEGDSSSYRLHVGWRAGGASRGGTAASRRHMRCWLPPARLAGD